MLIVAGIVLAGAVMGIVVAALDSLRDSAPRISEEERIWRAAVSQEAHETAHRLHHARIVEHVGDVPPQRRLHSGDTH